MRVTVTPGAAGSISAAPRAPKNRFGTAVPPSSLGFIGDTYKRTTTSEVYERRASGWVLVGSDKGEKGDDGDPGPMGTPLTGTALPDNDDGDDGQVYFRTYDDGAARSYYIKAAGAWGSPHDMRGPSRAAMARVTVTGNRTISESDLGKCLVVDSEADVTITFPAGLESGWSVLIRRKGNGAVILAAGAGATIAFQYVDDDRIAKVNGTVSVDNLNAAAAWVVSEGTADA